MGPRVRGDDKMLQRVAQQRVALLHRANVRVSATVSARASASGAGAAGASSARSGSDSAAIASTSSEGRPEFQPGAAVSHTPDRAKHRAAAAGITPVRPSQEMSMALLSSEASRVKRSRQVFDGQLGFPDIFEKGDPLLIAAPAAGFEQLGE